MERPDEDTARDFSSLVRNDSAVCPAAQETETKTSATAAADRSIVRFFDLLALRRHTCMFDDSIDWGVFVCEASEENARDMRLLVGSDCASPEAVVRAIEMGRRAFGDPLRKLMYVGMSLCSPDKLLRAACGAADARLVVQMAALVDCQRTRDRMLEWALHSGRADAEQLYYSLTSEAKCCVNRASAHALLAIGSVAMIAAAFRASPKRSTLEFASIVDQYGESDATHYCREMLFALSPRWRKMSIFDGRARGAEPAVLSRDVSPASVQSLA
jgi:hypothetical protein